MLTLSFSRHVCAAVAPRGAVLLERGGIEPRFVTPCSVPTPMGRSMFSGPVCPGCHASLTSALPPRSDPAGVPVFPGCQKYSLCRAKRRRLRTVDKGFRRQPRRAGSAGCQPAIVRQGKERKEETRSPAAPGNAPLPERPI